MIRDDYIEGIRLFNAGKFWHAHECWEQCWLGSPEPENTYYKGIIQAAAALYHWYTKDNPRGLHRNWCKSRAKLQTLPACYMGIDIDAFIVAMDAFVLNSENDRALRFPQLVFGAVETHA